ncbi:MAG TPA: flagellar FliJ family protein [Symbiobacteriaceae bacterium]|nr:flagellar FliJ family protein [Symbiobacteriaceae bacterium]
MKPFRFNLEKVLKVRQVETTKAKQALAAAQLASGQAWVQMENCRKQRIAFEADWEARRKGRMTAAEWNQASERQSQLVQVEKDAVDTLHRALAVVAERRAELEEAERKEKALTKLREQQYEAHEYAERAEEQIITDEIAQTVRRTHQQQKGVG